MTNTMKPTHSIEIKELLRIADKTVPITKDEFIYHEGFVDLQWLQSIVKDSSADFYFCGPVPFMKVIYRILKEWGVPAENIHYEFFGPAGTLEEEAVTA